MNIEKIRWDFPALDEWTFLDTSFIGLYPRQVRKGYDDFLDARAREDALILCGYDAGCARAVSEC